eukprot:3861078-Amphidinium_carterae.1
MAYKNPTMQTLAAAIGAPHRAQFRIQGQSSHCCCASAHYVLETSQNFKGHVSWFDEAVLCSGSFSPSLSRQPMWVVTFTLEGC